MRKIENFLSAAWRGLLVPAVIAFLAPPALADGGMFYKVGAEAGYSADQRAILVYNPDTGLETMVLHTDPGWESASADEKGGLGLPVESDYAWVVPVPSRMSQEDFGTLENGAALFDSLQRVSEPTGKIENGGGCAPDSCWLDGGGSARPGVNLLESFAVGGYEVSVLSAEDSNNMQLWLEDNGYQVREDASLILQEYIDQGWYFTAVKVAKVQMDEAGGDGTGADAPESPVRLEPLKLTFTTNQLIFPMNISAVSSRKSEPTEILLYVIAPHRMKVTSYETVEMTRVTDSIFGSTQEFRDTYNQEFDRLLSTHEDGVFIVEYASSPAYVDSKLMPLLDSVGAHWGGDPFLTRFRTRLPPETMNRDVIFDREWSEEHFILAGMSDPTAKHAAVAAFFLVSTLLACCMSFPAIACRTRRLRLAGTLFLLSIFLF
jgi:hypothetical protein